MLELYRPTTPVRLAALIAALAICPGCGDGRPVRVPVTGQVFIDGKPLEQGRILVHVENHRPATGKLGPDGEFELSTYVKGDGCVLGTHEVTINAGEVINANTIRWHAPPKYDSPSSSGLVMEVQESNEPKKFELTWDGGKPFNERVSGGGE